jgi:hypothetical protein
LRLVPADAGVTIAVEDLKGHARAFLTDPLSDGLRRLPAVKGWLNSDGFRGFRHALKRAETVLGADAATVRDDLLGEAFVLTLRVPPGGRPEEARGLLLLRAPDRPLLDRLIEGLNAGPLKTGELARVSAKGPPERAYFVREFREKKRPDEFYTTLPRDIFAWSNSEELILGVIDRHTEEGAGLVGNPAFRAVRAKLPERAVASLFVDPRFIGRLMSSSPRPAKPEDDRVLALIDRYLSAVGYAGATLQWRDGPIVHTEEVVDPAKLGPELKRWAGRLDRPDPALARAPVSALIMASAALDAGVIFETLIHLAAENDPARLDNLLVALGGLLLGLDARSEVIPHVGPGVSFYLERPEPAAFDRAGDPPAPRIPGVLTVEIARGTAGEKAATALDNALRTLLALHALGRGPNQAAGAGQARVEARAIDGVNVTSLGGPKPFAYAVREGRLVVGSSAEAVARAVDAQNEPKAEKPSRLDQLRSALFADTVSFACADLKAIHEFANAHRPALARRMAAAQKRPEPESARDLDEALALVELFDAAFFTSQVEQGFTAVHRKLGLVKLPSPARP